MRFLKIGLLALGWLYQAQAISYEAWSKHMPSDLMCTPSVHKKTVMVFFDYGCSHCRRLDPIIAQVRDQARICHVPLAMLGETSKQYAMAALLAYEHHQFDVWHHFLMTRPLSDVQTAVDQWHADDASLIRAAKQLQHYTEWAEWLNIKGVPTLIFFKGKHEPIMVSGVADSDTIKRLLASLN
jgi:thioredoxin-related protein